MTMRSLEASSLHRWAGSATVLLLLAAGCGDDSSGEEGAVDLAAECTSGLEAPVEGSGESLTMGYSAWPGWFPWAVTEEAEIFEALGVDVELRFFSDYIGSIDAMQAGQIDANSQTLNDTLVPVSAGSDQRIVIVNDNSAGNDAIIVDESIQSIEDLEGKTIAAEAGVVDHFLLLQGLESAGMTEDDIDFRNMLTDAAAAAFAGGQVDGVGVFAPFTIQALEREGSHVLFDSSDYPGTIPDHLAVSGELVEERPEDVQLLVDAWYATLDCIDDFPEETLEVLAEAAETSVEEYETFEAGTRLFSAEEALEAFESEELPTGLRPMAEQVNDFLVNTPVEPPLADEPAPLDDLFQPQFTEDYLARADG